MSLDGAWNDIEEVMMTIAKNEIGYKQKSPKKNWMTILTLFAEIRQLKNQGNRDEDRELQQTIRREIRYAKNKCLKKQYEKIEHLQDQHNGYNLQKKIKEAAGVNRKTAFSKLKMRKGKMLKMRNTRKSFGNNI